MRTINSLTGEGVESIRQCKLGFNKLTIRNRINANICCCKCEIYNDCQLEFKAIPRIPQADRTEPKKSEPEKLIRIIDRVLPDEQTKQEKVEQTKKQKKQAKQDKIDINKILSNCQGVVSYVNCSRCKAAIQCIDHLQDGHQKKFSRIPDSVMNRAFETLSYIELKVFHKLCQAATFNELDTNFGKVFKTSNKNLAEKFDIPASYVSKIYLILKKLKAEKFIDFKETEKGDSSKKSVEIKIVHMLCWKAAKQQANRLRKQ